MSDTQADAFVDTTHHDTYGAITPEQWNLTGRIVLVTGSSRGIGRASAVSYARAGASGIIVTGRSVALLDEVEKEVIKSAEMRKKSDGNTAPGPAVKVLKLVLDVTDEASANDAARLVRETFGRLDILVNNAGYISSVTSVLETQSEDWNQTWATNVTGPFLVTRALLPLLIGSKDGLKIIVNVNSLAALLNTPNYMAYISSKLALLRMTEIMETEYGASGILPISFHPGGVATDLTSVLPDEMRYFLRDSVELSADSLVWLTKERREWLSGRYVSAEWDVTELEAKRDEVVKGDKLKVRMVL